MVGPRPRAWARWLLAVLYGAAGILHLVNPQPFVAIVPRAVPAPEVVVTLTGLTELAGAAGLIQPWMPRLRAAAGWGLAAYALCVWPANFVHCQIDLARSDGGLGLAYHGPRLAVQPLIIWLALWAGGAADWPLRGRTGQGPS